jgi:PIN like domain
VSHPDGLPDLFLDRSLGRIKVPQLLRAAGLRLTSLAEHYGIPADESVADHDWLQLAGRRGWVVFMKDTRLRYNRPERQAVKAMVFAASAWLIRTSPETRWRAGS